MSLDPFLNLLQRRNFLGTLVHRQLHVQDRVVPKKNTLCIIGAPSSGKTYYARTLMSIAWKYGQIRNNKKGGDSFTYQDAINCRVAEWNECLLMGKEEIETAKMVWEGATAPINVKYQKNQRLQRTPLLVTANEVPWRMCKEHVDKKAFTDRAFVHHWTRQEWLKSFGLYPCPLLWHEILAGMDEDSYFDNIPSVEQLVAQVKSTVVDPNIYFDFWIRKGSPSVDTEQLLNDCILYEQVRN